MSKEDSNPDSPKIGQEMTIRPATGADRSGVVALWETVFPDDPPHNAPSKVFAAKLTVKDDMLLVAVDEDTIVGTTMAGYDGFRGWLHKVAVLPQYQRRGVAAALVRRAIVALRDAGCTKVNLQVRATNSEVRGFYQSLGFEIEERLSMGMHIG